MIGFAWACVKKPKAFWLAKGLGNLVGKDRNERCNRRTKKKRGGSRTKIGEIKSNTQGWRGVDYCRLALYVQGVGA